MKTEIHPQFNDICFEDLNTGKRFLSRSTMRSEKTEVIDGKDYFVVACSITSDSHPFYTGEKRLVDTAGRIDKFKQRYGNVRRAAQ
ncbi:MAG: large subunit ribosomal protein L31 [Verrucomicrobiales bacterium]|jgi:ribosomal protein L31